MEDLQQTEWFDLRERTWQHLRHKNHISRSKYVPLLQFLTIPSFSDTWCIDVVESDGITSAFLTTWNSTKDVRAFETGLERLKHPRPFVPSLQSTLLPVNSESIEGILKRFEDIAMPLKPARNSSIYLDGTSYELQFGEGHRGIRLSWHEDMPMDWPIELRELSREFLAIENSFVW